MEGPLSLARAFLDAGVIEVVATLAPVADNVAADVMARFYREVALGKGSAEALGWAQQHSSFRNQAFAFEVVGGI
jgi:CHAT domain-containing protein